MPTDTLSPATIASAESVAAPRVVDLGARVIVPASIASAESIGSPTLSDAGTSTIAPETIASVGSVGVPRVVEIPAGYTAPGGPLASGGRRVFYPHLDQLIDETTSETYDWPISHSNEEPFPAIRELTRGAPNSVWRLVRQQTASGTPLLVLSGAILDAAQNDKLNDFFDRCEDRTLVYRDYLGNEYEVLVTSYNSHRRATPANPRHVDLTYYWLYTITFRVLKVRAGSDYWTVP